jgi:radical SAM superfamily enzyme YgiQ (UPF0313 family)
MVLNVVLLKLNTRADEIIPPLSLGYLAASAPRHAVSILDAQKEALDDGGIVRRLREARADVLGVQVWTKDLPQARGLLARVRRDLPGVVTVVGGVQPSVMPLETYAFFGQELDFLFAGEAEAGFPLWLDAVAAGVEDFGHVPGLVWRRDGQAQSNPASALADLDSLAPPRWDLMPPDSYPPAPHGAFFNQFPVAPMITSRGCPFSCTFCSAPMLSGRSIRFRSLDNVFEEVELLSGRFGVRELHIEDDNFSLHKDYVLGFCERMRRLGRSLSWAFPNGVRLDTLDAEMLAAMSRAGCYALNFGIESGDDETLRRIKKKLTTAQIRERLALVRKFDFQVGGFFIIGFPWETEGHIENTIEFARSLDLDLAGFSFFQPFPGTELARELAAAGEFDMDLASFNTSLHTISYVPRAMTRQTLFDLRHKAMRRFYLRPRTALTILRRAKNPRHWYFIARRGWRWLTQ